MKKVLLGLICFLLIGCGTKNTITNDIEKFKEEYESQNEQTEITLTIDIDSSLKYLTVEQANQMLEEQTGILYLGYPTCPWCRNIVPILLEVAKENHMTIFYVNTKEARANLEQSDQFSKLISLLSEYLNEDESGNKVLYVPDIYFVKNGKIIGHHLGSVESQDNPYIPLTDDQRNELKTIYQEFINQIK